jgi:hypothetical protein
MGGHDTAVASLAGVSWCPGARRRGHDEGATSYGARPEQARAYTGAV